MGACVTDYLPKEFGAAPFDVLAERIERSVRRHRTRQAIEKAEQRLQELAAVTDDVLFMFDGDWKETLFINAAYEEIWGRSIEELKADPHSFMEAVHPDDTDRVEAAIERLCAGTPTSTEYRILTDDGEQRWVRGNAWPVSGVDGATDRIVGAVRDVTEYKQREQDLAEERERYESLIEQSQDGIIISQDGRYVFANPRAEEILGRSESDLEGMTITSIIDEEDRDMLRERYEQRMDPDTELPPARYTIRFVRPDGERRVAEINASRITTHGDPAALVSIRDVTERKRAQERLATRTRELEALNRLVRHDIRNDMAVVLGWISTLENHVEEDGQEYLEKIIASGEHVVELTDIAREYVETLASDGEVDLKEIALRETLETELELRRQSYPDARMTVSGEIPDVTVRANEMLSSVFRNLLNNAVQHNDTENPAVSVEVTESEDAAVVRVADDGPGIPDGQKESVFGKGEKSLDSDGTGIGLYLVETLLDGYGGDVWIEDNEPRGTIVTIELPLAE